MHLATTLRYGARLFVTRDKGILKKTDELATKFELMVLTPKQQEPKSRRPSLPARAREATREVPGGCQHGPATGKMGRLSIRLTA